MRPSPATLTAATLLALGLVAGTAQAATLHALTADGKLVQIDSSQRRAGRAVAISGTPGRVVSIALRPSNGKLYGLTDGNQLVTIDPATGHATAAAKLDKPLETGPRATINFNPTVDRLRVVGMGGTNYRINVDNGQVTVDGPLKYMPGSPYAGTAPRVTAVAYTNHVAGATETALYTIDTSLGQINLQAPPNDGVQQPKKQVAGGLPNSVGFDILNEGPGANTGFLLADGRLWSVAAADLEMRELGPVGGLPPAAVIGLAAAK